MSTVSIRRHKGERVGGRSVEAPPLKIDEQRLEWVSGAGGRGGRVWLAGIQQRERWFWLKKRRQVEVGCWGCFYLLALSTLSDSHIKSHPSDWCGLSAESVLVRESLQFDLKTNRGDQVLLNLNEETLNTQILFSVEPVVPDSDQAKSLL